MEKMRKKRNNEFMHFVCNHIYNLNIKYSVYAYAAVACPEFVV